MALASPYGVHWFRRDLRARGNRALEWNCKKHGGRVLGIFCVDKRILERPDLGLSRFGFFLQTLSELKRELQESGGDLLVLDEDPLRAFDGLLARMKDAGVPLPAAWSWNRDYEPYALERDAEIERLLSDTHGIETHTERDHLLVEPRELRKDREPGSFYQVFTPFQKRWLALLAGDEVQSRLSDARSSLQRKLRFQASWKSLLGRKIVLPDRLDEHQKKVLGQVEIPLPPAGQSAAREALLRFKSRGLAQYAARRDLLAVEGTSGLSFYIKNGSITVPEIIAELGLGGESHFKFLSELIWREFYYHILFHVPRVEQGPFQAKFEQIRWENRESHFEAWMAGRTGYPIVDAAMRQLLATGWMHNRARMIAASFLVKDLHVNWQCGEKHFMQKLLDGDLASNNGGWQWAASTGCDPQPFFRVFNPLSQSLRFDPQGEYIRRWVPELKHLRGPDLHEPWRRGAAQGTGYPKPIVDHSLRAKQAVELFRKASWRAARNPR